MADVACKGAALLCDVVWVSVRLLLELPVAVTRCAALDAGMWQPVAGGCTFYEGDVQHVRSRPLRHTFRLIFAAGVTQSTAAYCHSSHEVQRYVVARYDVRMALVDLDRPPKWFKKQSRDHMSAAAARAFAGTNGV